MAVARLGPCVQFSCLLTDGQQATPSLAATLLSETLVSLEDWLL